MDGNMNEIKTQIAKVALNKLFKQSHFSICTVRDICAMLHVFPDSEVIAMMQPLHCINYSDMSREIREWLFRTCLSLMNGERFNVEIIGAPESKQLQEPAIVSGF